MILIGLFFLGKALFWGFVVWACVQWLNQLHSALDKYTNPAGYAAAQKEEADRKAASVVVKAARKAEKTAKADAKAATRAAKALQSAQERSMPPAPSWMWDTFGPSLNAVERGLDVMARYPILWVLAGLFVLALIFGAIIVCIPV